MGKTKILLPCEFPAEILFGFPKINHVVEHFGKCGFDTVADITAFFKRFKLCLLLFALAVEGRSAGKHIFFDLGNMTFENQSEAEPVALFKHLVEMLSAEALFICFDPDVRFHHGSAENNAKLVFFQHVVEQTERTVRRLVQNGMLKRFVDRYGIYLFRHGFLPFVSRQLDLCDIRLVIGGVRRRDGYGVYLDVMAYKNVIDLLQALAGLHDIAV